MRLLQWRSGRRARRAARALSGVLACARLAVLLGNHPFAGLHDEDKLESFARGRRLGRCPHRLARPRVEVVRDSSYAVVDYRADSAGVERDDPMPVTDPGEPLPLVG